jgi:hypothetical protein
VREGRACKTSRICRSFDTVGLGEMGAKREVLGAGPESANFTGYRGWDIIIIIIIMVCNSNRSYRRRAGVGEVHGI